MSKALEQYKQAIMGGYDPTQAISYDNFMDARLSGLLNSMQNTNNTIQQNNLMDIGVEERKREEEKLARMKALREFGERMEILAQRRSGNPQIAAALQQQMDARKLAEQQRIEAAQRKAQQEEFIKNNPQFEQMIMFNQLFGMDMPQPKNPRIINQGGINYYEDGSKVLPNVADKQPTPKQIYDNLAADIKTTVANKGVEALTENQKTFYNTYLLRQNSGGFDKFLLDYIRGQGSSNKTANETEYTDTGERTPDGKKIVEKDGKRFVQVD
jgi:hypothetical protein